MGDHSSPGSAPKNMASVPLVTDPKLDAVLRRELDGDEQQLFASHFASFWHTADCKKDFVISLDAVYEWLGFTRKDAAKRALANCLEENVHYAITAATLEANSERGGQNKEEVKMTVHAFKRLCMAVKTERGEMVRGYYIALEEALFVYNKELAEEASAKLQALQAEHDKYVEKTSRAMKRRFADGQKGDVAYIYKDNTNYENDVYNLGRTGNRGRREKEYSTHNFSGEMIYAKRCLNQNILEKVTQHMLDQYRVYRDREWFIGPEDVLKDTLDTAQAVIDGYVDKCRNMLSTGVGAQIRELIASVPRDDNQPDTVPDYVIADKKAAEDKAARIKEKNSPKVIAPPPDVEPAFENDPSDYDAFIADMCEVRDDAYTLPAELLGAHRLWGRCITETVRKGVYTYLTAKFPKVKKEFADGSQRLVHVGVALKPRPSAIPEPTLESTDVELFLYEECREDFVGRVGLKPLRERFAAWKRRNGHEDYALCQLDSNRLDAHMKPHFMFGTLTSKQGSEYGYFGLVFKDDVARIGIRNNTNLRKRVLVLDPSTQPASLLKVCDSMQECASWFNTIPSSISTDISHNRMRKGLLIRKAASDDEELIKKYDPATSPDAPPGPPRVKVPGTGQWKNKAVEEIDAKTGKVVQVFETVKAAADDASVESARMSTIISKGRKLGNFYYRFAKPEDEAGPSTLCGALGNSEAQ